MTTAPARPGRFARWRTVRAQRAESLRRAGRLTTRTRSLLALLGTAMIGVGGVAVFKTKVEAGPTALITIGAVLVVLGAMGRQISSLNLKEGSLALEDVKDELSAADSPEQVVQTVVSAPPPVQRQLQQDDDIAKMSESAYAKVIADVLTDQFGDAVQHEVQIGAVRADSIVTLGGKRVVVETRLGNPSRPMSPDVLRRLVQPAYLTDHTVQAIVIVSASAPGSYLIDREQQRVATMGKSLSYATWTGPEDSQSLKHVIEAHLTS
ncbi:MAG: hypothetical protein ACJ736_02015 [Streptomyces sp.]